MKASFSKLTSVLSLLFWLDFSDLLSVRLRLKYSSTDWWRQYLSAPIASQATSSQIAQEQLRVAIKHFEYIRFAGRLQLKNATCLPKAICLVRRLRGLQIPAHLVLGVNNADTGFFAHAWVQIGDLKVGEKMSTKAEFTKLSTD